MLKELQVRTCKSGKKAFASDKDGTNLSESEIRE